MNFYIGSIHIGSVEGASCVNFGNNLPTDFKNMTKQNQGFGTIRGDHNEIKDIIAQLRDKKVLDLLEHSSEDEIPLETIYDMFNKIKKEA